MELVESKSGFKTKGYKSRLNFKAQSFQFLSPPPRCDCRATWGGIRTSGVICSARSDAGGDIAGAISLPGRDGRACAVCAAHQRRNVGRDPHVGRDLFRPLGRGRRHRKRDVPTGQGRAVGRSRLARHLDFAGAERFGRFPGCNGFQEVE